MRDTGNVEYRKGGFRTGEMWIRKDSGQERNRTGEKQDSWDAGQLGFRTAWIQNNSDSGKL